MFKCPCRDHALQNQILSLHSASSGCISASLHFLYNFSTPWFKMLWPAPSSTTLFPFCTRYNFSNWPPFPTHLADIMFTPTVKICQNSEPPRALFSTLISYIWICLTPNSGSSWCVLGFYLNILVGHCCIETQCWNSSCWRNHFCWMRRNSDYCSDALLFFCFHSSQSFPNPGMNHAF